MSETRSPLEHFAEEYFHEKVKNNHNLKMAFMKNGMTSKIAEAILNSLEGQEKEFCQKLLKAYIGTQEFKTRAQKSDPSDLPFRTNPIWYVVISVAITLIITQLC